MTQVKSRVTNGKEMIIIFNIYSFLLEDRFTEKEGEEEHHKFTASVTPAIPW